MTSRARARPQRTNSTKCNRTDLHSQISQQMTIPRVGIDPHKSKATPFFRVANFFCHTVVFVTLAEPCLILSPENQKATRSFHLVDQHFDPAGPGVARTFSNSATPQS